MSTASNGRFLGNHIHHLRAPDCSRGGAGIELQNYSGTNNDAIGNVVNDIFVPGDYASDIIISNNLVFSNAKGGTVIGGSLEGNDLPPGVASDVRVSNNLVVQNQDYGIRELGRVGLNTYANNLVFGNTLGGYSLIGGSVPTGTVEADPLSRSAASRRAALEFPLSEPKRLGQKPRHRGKSSGACA